MVSIFDHFPIVYQIVKYIQWNDIHSLKKINALCREVCEIELEKRCISINIGYIDIVKNVIRGNAKRSRVSYCDTKQLQQQMPFNNPSVLFIYTNKKGFDGLEAIITRQCSVNSIICRLYSPRGCFGVTEKGIKQCTSTRNGGLWWMSWPKEVQAQLMTKGDVEIKSDTKLVIVLNMTSSTNPYKVKVFNRDVEMTVDNAAAVGSVIYCGGLVRGLEIFDHTTQSFCKQEHISICLGGDKLSIDYLVMNEDYHEIDDIKNAFSNFKTKSQQTLLNKTVKYQCVLLFSCYLRNSVTYINSDAGSLPKTEYDLFTEYFPGVMVHGVYCEGEIFHRNEGVLQLVKSLHSDDIDGVTSMYILLSWSQ